MKMDKKMKKRVMKYAALFVFGILLWCEPSIFAQAAPDTSKVTARFDALTAVVKAVISSVGTIITLWGISEWGMAYQGQEGSMQAHAFKRVGGGLIMVLAPQILSILV